MSEIRFAVLFAGHQPFPSWLTLASSGSSSPPSCTGNACFSGMVFTLCLLLTPLPRHSHPFLVPPRRHVCSREVGCLAYLSHKSYSCAFVLGPIILFKPFIPYSQHHLFISNPPFEVKINSKSKDTFFIKSNDLLWSFFFLFYRIVNSICNLTLDRIQAASTSLSPHSRLHQALWPLTHPGCFP